MTPRRARLHRTPGLVLLVSLTCALAACSASTEDPDETTRDDVDAVDVVPSAGPETPAAGDVGSDTDSQFVSWVRMNGVSEDTLSDELILTTVHETCSSLDAGDSLASVVDALATVDVSDEGRETLVALPYAAISIFCPVHADKIQ